MDGLDQLLREALGKKLESRPFQELMKKLGEPPFINDTFEDVFYYEFKEKGVSFLFNKDNQVLEAIHLFGEESEGYQIYSDQLPCDLSFKMSKNEALQYFGEPSYQGGGNKNLLGETIPNWIKYVYPDYQLHLEFKDQDRQIALVTLMIPDPV